MNQTDKINPLLKETFVFRPLPGQTGMLRYADGAWIPDDGKPDLAFVAYADAPLAFYVDMPYHTNILWGWNEIVKGKRLFHYQTIGDEDWGNHYWDDRSNHPNEIAGRSAMDKCCNLYRCANGRGIPLTRDTEYIRAGALLIQSTGLPVKAPENPICYLCLNEGRGHYLAELRSKRAQLEADIENFEDDIEASERKLEDAKGALEYAEEQLKELEALLQKEQEERL